MPYLSHKSFLLGLALLPAAAPIAAAASPSATHTLFANQPATNWSQECYPIGNGRLGAMSFGGVIKEVVQFNEQSLWSGDNNWNGDFQTGDHGFGNYRNFGDFTIWYATHVFDHWAFTRDRAFLTKTGYPMLKEICQLWEDRLKAMPDGSLVVPQGWSPEHGPTEDGVMHDQQLIWELFEDYLIAARELGVDAAYQKTISGLESRLAPNKIGKWGQLQEWQTDRDEPGDIHRHTSHLFAVYPGRQISVTKTPELAKAATISLLARSGINDRSKNLAFTACRIVADKAPDKQRKVHVRVNGELREVTPELP